VNNVKYYYRFKAIIIDDFNEKDIKKHNKELNSFEDLADRFHKLRVAFDNDSSEQVNIIVNAFPALYGAVSELSVGSSVKRKLFSKEIKSKNFALMITKSSLDNIDVLGYETNDFEEVKQIFYDFITKQALPNLIKWKHLG